jgi:hypothetical protein
MKSEALNLDPLRSLSKVGLIAGLILVFVASAWAAGPDVSAVAGYGHIGGEAEDVRSQSAAVVGASLNTRLGPEIKIDYENVRWDRNGSLHLLGVGWLIQSAPKRTRPFFQIGWVLGIESAGPSGSRDKFQGLAAAAGFTQNIGSRFLIRPELRWKLIGPGPIMLTIPALSAGYRF